MPAVQIKPVETSSGIWVSKWRPRLPAARKTVSDGSVLRSVSQISSQTEVASSDDLGWQQVRAVRLRLQGRQTFPASDRHCIVVHLGPSLHMNVRIGDQQFSRHVRPGDITIVPAGTNSEWRWTESKSCNSLYLYIGPDFVRAAAESSGVGCGAVQVRPQFAERDEHIRHIAMSLLHELNERNVAGRLYADSLASVLAVQLARRYSYFQDVQVSRGGMAPRKLRQAIEFINEKLNLEHEISLSSVAEAIGMSYFHFSRTFKQSMNMSPNNYLVERRIEHAKRLLGETNLPVVDIALRAGFASQSHFTTTFRKLVGATPKVFRDML